MNRFILRTFLVLALILTPLIVLENNQLINISYSITQAQSIDNVFFPAKPTKDIYVVDSANLFNETTKKKLLTDSHKLYQEYNTQIAVVTIDSLNGLSVEEYTNQLFRKWGIGDKKENSGILILISKNDHKARIEVGYGLEGIINDGKAGRILKSMLAEFKKDRYNEGVLKAHELLVTEITNGKDKSASKAGQRKESSEWEILALFIVFGLIVGILIVLNNSAERKRKKQEPDSTNVIDYINTGMFLDDISKHTGIDYSPSNYDDDDDDRYSSSDSSDWGSSDSSDDSFGGGDSGGGGASDDW